MEGESLGIQKGQLEAKRAIACKLLEQKLSIEVVSQITELPIAEVKVLYDKLQIH